MAQSGYGSRGSERGYLGGSWDDGDHVRGRRRRGTVYVSVSSAALWRALDMVIEKWSCAFSMVQCLARVEGWTRVAVDGGVLPRHSG